ncbi:MAG TPA: SigB/SigF/SigG family RNA polymerase sigma factor [Actinomycetota bacterium]|nr:SigB/SigF/SigG family RNA polymerase sigma factor [Actinomycetota bacterium]
MSEEIVDHDNAPADATREEKAALLFPRRGEPGVREELVRLFYPLAEHLARRFAGRGESYDDLVQVASIGLLKAVDRFDVERGVRFDTYAVPTIVGELKRHFRDTGWAMRVPRRLQDQTLRLRTVIAELGQELGRSPRIPEIAVRSGLSEDDVIETLDAVHALSVGSIDAPVAEDEQGVAETLGSDDAAMAMTEQWADVAPLLRRLPERERHLLYYRFVLDLSQSEIADKLGISQMHVSRLLSRTFAMLREAAGEETIPTR